MPTSAAPNAKELGTALPSRTWSRAKAASIGRTKGTASRVAISSRLSDRDIRHSPDPIVPCCSWDGQPTGLLRSAIRRPRNRRTRTMTLIINNDDVAKVLTMETTLAALEESYLALAAKTAVCRPRIDIRIPTSDPAKNYQWGTREGGSTAGYFAIRMKSDIIYETQYNGVTTQEKYCMRPGLYCGLILLTSIQNGEFLAFINDGHLQHVRVAGDGGIGVKYMAKEDAEVVGMLGSGGMARTHMQ